MKNIAPFIVRIGIGGLFLITGMLKLFATSDVITMVANIGFPYAKVFAWLLILSELLCGAAVIVGFKLRYAIAPLCIILFLGVIVNPANSLIDQLKNIALLAATVSLAFGAGAFALKEHK